LAEAQAGPPLCEAWHKANRRSRQMWRRERAARWRRTKTWTFQRRPVKPAVAAQPRPALIS